MRETPGTTAPPRVVLRDATTGEWLAFESPQRLLVARRLDEVLPLLREVESAVAGEGLYAAGFVSYEAAPAFDARLPARTDGSFPYLWFGLFERPRTLPNFGSTPAEGPPDAPWRSSITAAQYRAAFDRLREYIRNGDTYQVNFTYRLRARIQRDPWSVFLGLVGSHESPYGAYVDTGDWAIASASPELFFRLEGETDRVPADEGHGGAGPVGGG